MDYDHHFIIKELAEKFEKQFTCLGKILKKYITFSVPVQNEATKINKSGEKITKTKSYRLQLIDSIGFMASSLLNLVKNLSEAIYETKCKYKRYNKKCETFGVEYIGCKCFLE